MPSGEFVFKAQIQPGHHQSTNGHSKSGYGRVPNVRDLYSASPVGVVGAGVAGLMVGSFCVLGVVFARKIGLSVSEAALFMSAVVFGDLASQRPIDALADRYDRRVVMSGALMAVGTAWGTLAGFIASGLPLPDVTPIAMGLDPRTDPDRQGGGA